jgi:hypothetical protein
MVLKMRQKHCPDKWCNESGCNVKSGRNVKRIAKGKRRSPGQAGTAMQLRTTRRAGGNVLQSARARITQTRLSR